jgi:outer membrane immunogenic protein
MRHARLAILATTALTIAGIGESRAADWTGFYAGANIGYSWGRAHTDVTVDPITDPGFQWLFPGATYSLPLKPNGVIGGAQFGRNWQTGNWVFGWETDFQFSGQKDSKRRNDSLLGIDPGCTTICDFFSTTDVTAKLSWFGTVRGRIGQDLNGLLFYTTGGLAYGHVKLSGSNTVSVDINQNGTIDAVVSKSFSASKTKAGWTLGAGVEGAAWANWTWRLEYIYLDLGSISASAPGVLAHSSHVTDNIVRFALNYRIPAP